MTRRSVFFDFGGTLCHSRADILPVFREAARRAKVQVRWPEYLRANEECWDELWPEAPQMVGKSPSFADRVHEMALRRIGFDGPIELLVQYIREEATSPRWQVPFPETAATLVRLREHGTSIHVVSGHVDYLPIIIANLGWSNLFDTVTFTQEVGFQKPDPRVFRFALERANQEPEGGTFVGDSWEADYLGAKSVGMTAIWLNRTGRPAPGPCRQIGTLGEVPSLLAEPEGRT
ncbi:MAG: HAD family hydrolase [Thermoplasmata archaeon]